LVAHYLLRTRRHVPDRGPEVDMYLKRAGANSGLAWCCAFVYWCFDEAALSADRANPMFRTAGCLAHWNNAVSRGARRISAKDAVADPDAMWPPFTRSTKPVCPRPPP
jgi:hypothetical protein